MTRTALAASIAVFALQLLAGTAIADEIRSLYATANVGIGSLSSTTLTFSDGNTAETAEADYSASFAGGGTLGYRFGNGWSVEGEIMYRRNELDPVNVPGLGQFNEGDFASLGFGINALYQFDIGSSGKLNAYIGPGFVYLQEIDIDFDNSGQQEISFETDDIAWQLKLGGRYSFTERWFMDAAATYLVADGVKMALPADATNSIESDYDHLTLSVGIGWRF